MLGRVALPMLLAAVGVQGHGYVREPASRPYLCRHGGPNQNCGAVQWEPQSVEGPDRYPESGPPDGTLAAAGSDRWLELNEQSSTRWVKVPAKAGPIDVTWYLQANHLTRDWRYFITKDGWNPDIPLARSSFESTPFCTVSGQMQIPPVITTHTCTLPSKTGYHVVFAVWDVGDTANTFYNAIDLDYGAGGGNTGGTPTPVMATPTPPAPACTTIIPLWGNCLNSPACCESGARCDPRGPYYAQCVVGTGPTPPTPPPTPQPVVVTPTPPTTPRPAPPPGSNCQRWTIAEADDFEICAEVQGDMVVMDLRVKTRGWVGFGIADPSTPAAMTGADIAVIEWTGNVASVSDRFARGRITPHVDTAGNEWAIAGFARVNGVTTGTLRRRIAAGSPTGSPAEDRPFVAGPMDIILAYGTDSEETLTYHHGRRLLTQMTFFDADPVTPTPVTTPQPTPAPVTNNCPGTIPEWAFCLNAPGCCGQGQSCYQHNMYFAQCLRPENNQYGGMLIQ